MDNSLNIFRLDNRVALITGGASGIGKGCAELFSKAGAKIFIADISVEKLKSVQNEIIGNNGECGIFAGDLTVEDNCQEMVVECIKQFGRLDIIVNSAGTTGSDETLAEEFETENYRHTMAVDFDIPFMTIKHSYKYLSEKKKGSIINISSSAAIRAKGPLVYSAAKGAIKSMSKNLAKKLGGNKIRVNTIYPGFIITGMTERITEYPDLVKHYKNESPLNLLGDTDDIAYCALYLASDASKFVTGQDFLIDGGSTI